jgi:dolichol-phosphate mannosyltransferase
MKIVVILPTYNERDTIIALLDGLHVSSKQIKHHSITYLVVDDTSPDGTKDVVLKYQKKHSDVKIISGKKEGLGKALLRGISYALDTLHADIIHQMDADLSHDPEMFPEFIKAIDHGYTFVVGTRYISGGSIPENWGIHRKIFSVIGNSIVRFGLGYPKIHDWTGGFRAYTKYFAEKLRKTMEEYKGYVFQIAFLHKSVELGAKIYEVPIHFTDRKYGKSKIAPSQYIRDVLVYVVKARIEALLHGSFGKFLIVGGTGFIINAIILKILHDVFYWNATYANLVGAAFAIFSNYNLNNIWTFKAQKISSLSIYFSKLLQFYLTSAFGVILIQTGTIFLGVKIFGDSFYFLFFLIGTAILLVWNYIIYSKVIWKKNVS